MKDATDLKAQFNKHPGAILGAAVASGFVLALAVGRSSQSYSGSISQAGHEHERTTGSTHERASQLTRVSDTINDIFAGLVGVFTEKLHSFVADAVPEYRQHYDAIKQRDPGSDLPRSSF